MSNMNDKLINDRVCRLEVYNCLLKTPYMTIEELASKLNKEIEDIEISIASLRQMFRDDEIARYVCASEDGYYLSSDSVEKYKMQDYEQPVLNYGVIDLKKPRNEKKVDSQINIKKTNSDFDNINTEYKLNGNEEVNDKVLTLDLKKKLDNNIKLVRVNVVDEENIPTFSLTIGFSES